MGFLRKIASAARYIGEKIGFVEKKKFGSISSRQGRLNMSESVKLTSGSLGSASGAHPRKRKKTQDIPIQEEINQV